MIDYIPFETIPTFLLVFARLLAFFIVLPLFAYRTIPMTYKIGFAFFLSLIVIPNIEVTVDIINAQYLLLLIKEVTVGLFIGLIAYIVLSVVQIAGGFIDFQMGFAIANVIDPQTEAQSPLIGQYFYIFALLFLLSVNGHYLLIDGMYNSFRFIPIDSLISFQSIFGEYIIQTFNKMFLIAFQMALPLVGCLFLVDVALGIVARAVPQLNVFVVGLPIKITVSFLVLSFFLAIYMMLAKVLFETMFETMRDLMAILGG